MICYNFTHDPFGTEGIFEPRTVGPAIYPSPFVTLKPNMQQVLFMFGTVIDLRRIPIDYWVCIFIL